MTVLHIFIELLISQSWLGYLSNYKLPINKATANSTVAPSKQEAPFADEKEKQ